MKHAFLLGFCLPWLPVWAGMATYPRPGGITPSDQYAVTVRQGGHTADSFVYITRAQWRSNRSKTTSWTTFSFSGKVTVAVKKLKGSFTTCRILPSSYGIQPRIENAHWRLVNLVMKKTKFSARSKAFGQISNLTFRNITVDGPMKLPNTIRGASADHRISNVTFENVKVNGKYLTSAAEGNFEIDPTSTDNIRFVVTSDEPSRVRE